MRISQASRRVMNRAAPPIEGRGLRGILSSLLPLGDEGAATTEAVIMLPFFILVWGSLLWIVQSYNARIRANILARDCGWSYAQSGCDEVPAQCSEAPTDIGAADGGDSSTRGTLTSSIDSTGIPILSGLISGIFGNLQLARHYTNVNRPEVVGGGSYRATGQFAILCNERPRAIGEVAQDVLCDAAGSFGGLFGC